METRRFLNQTQPQTLQGATILLYINAVFAVLRIGSGSPFVLAVILGGVAAYGIANDQKWGYYGGIAVALLALLGGILQVSLERLGFNLAVSLAFQLLLVYLLLHPMSLGYKRTWFK